MEGCCPVARSEPLLAPPGITAILSLVTTRSSNPSTKSSTVMESYTHGHRISDPQDGDGRRPVQCHGHAVSRP